MIMNTKVKKILMMVLLFAGFFSCQKTNDLIPYVSVDFYINLNDIDYSNLRAINGFVYVTGGVKGIIVFRKAIDEFVAYERDCPYDANLTNARVTVNKSTLNASDTVCHSVFSLILDGSVQKGPSTQPLREYAVQYNSDTQVLHVYSGN